MSVPGKIANSQEISDNEDNSIMTITDMMSTMQIASNANIQSVNAGTDIMRKDIATLRAEVQASRQAIVKNTTVKVVATKQSSSNPLQFCRYS